MGMGVLYDYSLSEKFTIKSINRYYCNAQI